MLLKAPPGVIGLSAVPTARSGVVLIALCLLAPFVFYLSTAESIVDIWNSSETFAHGYVILPISLWLVWRRRELFSQVPPQPWWPALVPLLLAGAAWLAASVGEVQVVRQYAFVSMFPLAALALLGPRLAGKLAFPLLFLLFAVPVGEIFVAPLIEFTANFTVWAVRAVGIPVLRNGSRFELPTGSWSVVEACSGIRYLISSVTLGSLYAYLTYRTTLRRLMFVGLAIVVPVIANGLRAFMIVMIGHLSGMKLATGVDHLIYGWLFFGLVMFVMFWIGSFWREDTETRSAQPSVALPATAPASTSQIATMAAAVLAVVAMWPALEHYNQEANRNPNPVTLDRLAIDLPQVPAFSSWTPHYMEPDAGFSGTWQAEGHTPVGLTVLYYRNQDSDHALISSLNRLAGYKDAWNETSSTPLTLDVAGHSLPLRESVLAGPAGKILVWHWMWIGDHHTSSNYAGKLWQALSRLLLRGDDGAAVMLCAPFDERPDQARASLRAFAEAHLATIDATLRKAEGH